MKTAWFDRDTLPFSMLNAGFKPLAESDHFPALNECFEKVSDQHTLLDLGCGAAEVFETFGAFEYNGADLPHIIDHVAKKKNPTAEFIYFDANTDSYEFLSSYDVVLMNSFISEVPDWYRVLSKVLYYSDNFVVIHRQEVTSRPSYLQDYKTYGSLTTIKSVINYEDLKNMFTMNGYSILHEILSFPGNNTQKTFLLKKTR